MKHRVRTENDCVIVSFSGDIDLRFSAEARSVLMDNSARARAMIVDMSGVELIDSSGIASLLEAFQKARKKGQPFYIVSLNESVLRVFRLARLETVFDIEESAAAAMNKI